MTIVDGFFDFIEPARLVIVRVAFVLVFGAAACLLLTGKYSDNWFKYRHPLYRWMFDQSKKEEDLKAETKHRARMAPYDRVAFWCLGIGVALLLLMLVNAPVIE